jgi:hypothetical protein
LPRVIIEVSRTGIEEPQQISQLTIKELGL